MVRRTGLACVRSGSVVGPVGMILHDLAALGVDGEFAQFAGGQQGFDDVTGCAACAVEVGIQCLAARMLLLGGDDGLFQGDLQGWGRR